MYIIAIAWLYVAVLMALTETNIVAGALTLVFYGLLPVSLLMWLVGSPLRRRRRRAQDAQEEAAAALAKASPAGETAATTEVRLAAEATAAHPPEKN